MDIYRASIGAILNRKLTPLGVKVSMSDIFNGIVINVTLKGRATKTFLLFDDCCRTPQELADEIIIRSSRVNGDGISILGDILNII